MRSIAATRSGPFAYRDGGSCSCAVRTLEGSYPTARFDVRKYARTSTPPDTSSATHKAVCAIRSAVRHRWRSRDPLERQVLNAVDTSEAFSAGTTPAAIDDSTAHPAANSATRQ